MFESLFPLIILFLVIFDPLASFVIFLVATSKMNHAEREKTVTYALIVAGGLSLLVLLLGSTLLWVFNTNLQDFQIAGGLVLAILGVKMVLGYSLTHVEEVKNNSGWAIASIIGTPLLTGPATITAIIISSNDYGKLVTGLAVFIVLVITAFLFYNAERANKYIGRTTIQVTSTILGLITLAWGVRYILTGLGL